MAGKLRLVLGLAIPIAGAAYGIVKLREWQRAEERRIDQSIPVVVIPLTETLALPPEASASRPQASAESALSGAVRTSGKPVLDGTTLVLEGSASALDAAGALQMSESGSFELVLDLLDGGEPFSTAQPVAVRAGRWTVQQVFPRAPRLRDLRWSARRLVLGGKPVRSAASSRPVPESGVIALAGSVVEPSLVHVLGADTRAELREIEVRTLVGLLPRSLDHRVHDLLEPSDATVEHLLASTSSPIELSASEQDAGEPQLETSEPEVESDLALYWVRAPGYAWGRIAIDHARGGERTLVLERAGELAARLERWSEDLDLRVRVYRRVEREIGALVAQREPPPSGVARFDGLAPGRYEVRVEIGRAFPGDRPTILRSVACELRAEKPTELRLVLEPPPRPIPAPLAGTLTWPLAWRAIEGELVIRTYGAPPLRPGWIWRSAIAKLSGLADEGVVLAWKAGEVAPGKHFVEVRPLRHYEIVDVGARGSIFTSIEIPRDYSGVRVQLSDPGSTQATPVRWLLWKRAEGEPDGVAPFTSFGAKTADVFFLSAFPGELRIVALNKSHRYALSSQQVTARAGGTETVLQVLPACRLRVRLRERGRDVPADPLWVDGITIHRVTSGAPGPALSWPFDVTRHDVEPDLYDPARNADTPYLAPGGLRPAPTREAIFDVDVPGEHEIVFPPITGMRAMTPRRVTLAREAAVEVVVEIEAER